MLRLGPEVGNAAALVVGAKVQVQADGVVDAADETHARVGLFFHDAVSLCRLHYSIDAGFGQTAPLPNSFGRGPVGRMTHVVEADVAPDPADVGLLCATGMVFEANGITDLSNSFLGWCSAKG